MKKVIKGLAILVVLVVIIVVVVANFFLGSIVQWGVETGGPVMLGVPVKLESVKFALVRGHVGLRGFVLGNPKGFKTEKALSVDEITVDLDVRSLLSDTIIIKRIYIDAPDINYELGLGKSNLGRLLEQAGGAPQSKGENEPEAKKSSKKVVIDEILIENGKVHVSAKMTMGATAPIPLPTIRLTDIGKEENKKGASPADVIRTILGAILGSVGKLVTGTVGLVGDGVKAVGGVAMDAAGAVGDGAKSVGGAAVDVAGATAGAVGDGAKAVGGAVGDGAKAVGRGAGKVFDGVTGIFKSDKPEEAAVTNETVPVKEVKPEE
ncbi:MAG TPA: AsmA family protein [Kiritimatiellia bacterium]|nr:AsmA family protein [Kiritimatiellia bacterium]